MQKNTEKNDKNSLKIYIKKEFASKVELREKANKPICK